MSLLSKCVAYYKLDGNSNDAVGSQNGSSYNVTYGASYAKINQGILVTNPTNGCIFWNHNFGLTGTQNRSIAFAVQFKSSLSNTFGQPLFDMVNSSGCRILLRAGFQSGVKKVELWCGSSLYFHNINYDEWYHFAIDYTSSNIKLYINNSLVYSGTPSTTVGATACCGLSTYYDQPYGWSYSGWNCWFDEIFIGNDVLSTDEHNELYNGGALLQYPFTTNKPSLFPFFNHYL